MGKIAPDRALPPADRKPALRQSFLDLGQRNFHLVKCPVCSMVYAPGQPEDEALHRQFHGRSGRKGEATAQPAEDKAQARIWGGRQDKARAYLAVIIVKQCEVCPAVMEAYLPITWDLPLSLQRESACVSPRLADGEVRRADSAQEAPQGPRQSSPGTQTPTKHTDCCPELRDAAHQVWQVVLDQSFSLPCFWIFGRLDLPANSCAHCLWCRHGQSMCWAVRQGLSPNMRPDWV